ncbi:MULTISPECIES: citrate synthase [unclassified Rhodococcus (in: high G+C Gram-positive bacteria)]|uniref:citrate synthase n=1 Tax=unclassified Rhodococcus (in: high G+C Gram-positive bacteria) TaxID=192944 RepID=UPI00211B1301|nr:MULTISPECIES: citrate synthase [unclassified Rhodococcus (in: high G+C Gram-positive bacteria)]
MTHADGRNMLTTAQAAARLGVKPETVYAYVSRGLLTSTRLPGVRGSVFDVDEVEALAGRDTARRTDIGAVERIRTRITLIDDGHLYYRGRDAVELSSRTFESVAHFVWTGELLDATRFVADPVVVQRCRDALGLMAPNCRSIDRIRIAVDIASTYRPMRFDTGSTSVVREAGQLLLTVAAALGGGSSELVIAESVWDAIKSDTSDPNGRVVLQAALVLMADHGLAASTLGVRVAASTRANLYSIVSAGLGCIDGPLHGSAADPVHRFLTTAIDDPIGALATQLRSGERVPGFGHVIYTDRDPRAEEILRLLRDPAHGADPVVVTAADTIIEEVSSRFEAFPNSDFALATFTLAYGLRADTPEMLFALARIVGWTAHALEEYDEEPLRFRVPGIYTGTRPGTY